MDAFYGEVRIFSFNYPPVDWALCWGDELSISQNSALYSVIGMTYGGSISRQVFCIPNLHGRVPLGSVASALGRVSGTEGVTMTHSTMPAHSHTLTAKSVLKSTFDLETNAPSSDAWLGRPMHVTDVAGKKQNAIPAYAAPASGNVTMAPSTLAPFVGDAKAHENRQPYLVMNFCICVNGVYPPRPN